MCIYLSIHLLFICIICSFICISCLFVCVIIGNVCHVCVCLCVCVRARARFFVCIRERERERERERVRERQRQRQRDRKREREREGESLCLPAHRHACTPSRCTPRQPLRKYPAEQIFYSRSKFMYAKAASSQTPCRGKNIKTLGRPSSARPPAALRSDPSNRRPRID